MKRKGELSTLKNEAEELKAKLSELTKEKLEQVAGGSEISPKDIIDKYQSQLWDDAKSR